MRTSTTSAALMAGALLGVSHVALADDSAPVVGDDGSVREAKTTPRDTTSAETYSPLPYPTGTLTKETAPLFMAIARHRDGIPLIMRGLDGAWLVIATKPSGAVAGVEVRF